MEALGTTNTSYDFRISSGNERGGVSPVSTETDTNRPVQLFFEALPAVSAISVSSLSSSPNTTLVVSWTNTPTECYLFSSHISVCTPTNGGETEPVPGTSSSADVTGLDSDSAYSCLVRSTVSDLVGREFPTMTSSSSVNGFTYPDYPEEPSQPQAVKPEGGTFPSTNITVQFPLPSDHSTINHYLVLVVRLRSEKDLPTSHPDTDYPAGYMFPNETTVNDASIERPLQGPYIAAEIAGQDFSGEFVIGGGRQPKYSPQYKNGPLLSGTKYSCFLRAFPRSSVLAGRSRRQAEEGGRQDLVFSSSDYMSVQETGSEDSSGSPSNTLSPAVTGVIVAGVIVSLILIAALVLILVLVYCVRSRRGHKYRLEAHSASLSSSSKGSMDIPHDSTPELCRRGIPMELKPLGLTEEDSELIPSGAIPVNVFREHVDKFDENRQLLFQREFDWTQANAPDPPAEASSLPINDDKNRYSNIKAFDHSRVVLTPLEGEEGSDYINANFIPGYKRTKEYISTQGPLEQTVADFWKMVWEQNTATIVMLTNLVEAGKVKCAQYWPSPALGSITYEDIDVKLDNVVELRDYTVRNFTVTHVPSSQSHVVLQFHYTKWPDYGTPKLAAPLLNFLRAVHSSNPPDAGPILVHCSAGVGRSGTVICIDYCLAKLKADRVIDVRGFVSRMREHRNYMVQTETQYAFIHYAILEAVTYGDTSFTLSDFSQSYQSLQQESKETGKTTLEEEYARLGSVKTMSKASTFVQRVKQKGPTNRSIHYPGHASYSGGANPHEYNAHFIDAYFTPKLFVVADGPQERNAGKFWQMVWDQDCSYVIMLTPHDAKYYSYWPTKGEHETYGNIKVTVEEESAEHYYTTRVVSIANAKLGVSQKVMHYQFVGWSSTFLPPVPTFVSFVCDVLEGVEGLQRNKKALIHDTKSLGPSGIFCSLCFCIERLRIERIVDVFQAVQNMQLQRPGTVQSMQEYAFIYDSVYEYIRTHLST
jgi:protein tyrosine phosphatase